MQCQFLGSSSPIERAWHYYRCAECRAAAAADAAIARGLDRLNAEPAPAKGLAAALVTFRAAPAVHPARRRRWVAVLRHRYLPPTAVSGLALAGLVGWLVYIDMEPEFAIPVPAMPVPNAYDLHVKAGAAIPARERTNAVDGVSYSHSSLGYALTAIEKANKKGAARGDDPHARTGTIRMADGVPQLDPADREAVLRDYREALALVRQSFRQSYLSPPIRSMSATKPYLVDDRQLARAFSLEAYVRESHQDFGGAADSSLDAMQLGAQMTHGGGLIDRLSGTACDAIGRRHLWTLVDRLNGAQASAAVSRLEQITMLRAPLADTLEEEKWTGLAIMKGLFRQRDWRRYMTGWPGLSQSPGGAFLGYIKLLPYTKTRIAENYLRLMDDQIIAAQQPYNRSNADRIAQLETSAEQAKLDPVAAMLLPSYNQTRFQDVAGPRTQDALLLTALALRAYRLDRGYLPTSLNELTPQYLSEAPLDPFGRGQRLRYRGAGAKNLSVDGGQRWFARLYSVGPDGKDDGGQPIDFSQKEHPQSDPAARYAIWSDSKGDIVAGVNTIAR